MILDRWSLMILIGDLTRAVCAAQSVPSQLSESGRWFKGWECQEI